MSADGLMDKLKTLPSDRPVLVAFDGSGCGSVWQSVGDPVMGGRSEGVMMLSDQGWGEFHGTVRADNGGGFASVKLDLVHPVDASGYQGIELLARGDGKTYKVGLRNNTDRGSVVYQHSFTSDSQEWSRIQLPFSDFVPTWRGRTVTNAEPLNTRYLASLSLFVSGAQVGEFELCMRNWVLF